ncbi:hypothetical protein [Nocardia paucivorans]|nr:hypothetical protein [Nocardia paucivorans]
MTRRRGHRPGRDTEDLRKAHDNARTTMRFAPAPAVPRTALTP